MKRIFTVITFVLFCHMLSAQSDSTTPVPTPAPVPVALPPAENPASTSPTAIVKGIVIDEKDNSPMADVNVVVRGTTTGTRTDDKGAFEIRIPLGTANLTFTYIGYRERAIDVLAMKADVPHTVTVKMTDLSKELDIVVVSGSKMEKKIGEQTESIEVLRGESITNSAQGLAEAINKVTGVNMVGKTISVRGGSGFSDQTSNRTLVLLDDVPMVSPENGSVRWETMPTEAIDQMEILKSSATVTNGAQALNALVNVRTINAQKDEPYNKLYLSGGGYFPFQDKSWTWFWKNKVFRPAFGNIAYVHARKYKNLDVVYNGALSDTRSYAQLNKNITTRHFIKLRYIPKNKPNLSVGGMMNVAYEKYDDFFIYQNFNDTAHTDFMGNPRNPTNDSSLLVPIQPTIEKLITLNVNPYVAYYDKQENKHTVRASYYYVLSNNTSGDSGTSHKIFLEYLFTRKFKKADADVIAGIRSSFKRILSHTFGNRSAEYVAAYAQMEKRFDKRFTIKIGVSLEYNKLDTVAARNDLSFVNALAVRDSAHRITSPIKPVFNLGINYKLTEGTFLRASFGQGYRFPDIAEQFVLTPRSGAVAIPNPNLKPESSWNAEVGIKQGMKFSRWVFYADVAAYISRYNNLIEFVNVKTSEVPKYVTDAYPLTRYGIYEQAQNFKLAQIWGIEVSAIGTGKIFGVPLNFLIGYNYMDPKNLNYDAKNVNLFDPNHYRSLYYRMKHSAKADVQTVYKNFIIGVTCVYIGHMEQVDPQLILQLPKIQDWYNYHGTNGDVILDARLGYSFKNQFTATLIAKNVTNHAYVLRPGFVEAPASLTLQLTYKWGKIFPLATKERS